LSSPGTLYVSGVKVEPEHRRKGIATKLYRMAERHFNMKVGNDSYKTPDGDAFRSTYRSREFEDDE
jgi:ribosomal protein S18 acetylase RimI-like enzyme